MADPLHVEKTPEKGTLSEKVPVSVIDRRHWVGRAEGEEEDGREEPPARRLPTYLEKLEQHLREKDERLKAFMAEQQAENEAYRKRVSRQAERRVAAAKREVMKPILSVLDDLSRAVEAASKGEDPTALLAGVTLIRENLLASLQLHGLSLVETQGIPFNPELHEAVGVVDVDDPSQENLVLEVIESGYLLEGDLLRPAKVRVGKHRGPEGVGSSL